MWKREFRDKTFQRIEMLLLWKGSSWWRENLLPSRISANTLVGIHSFFYKLGR